MLRTYNSNSLFLHMIKMKIIQFMLVGILIISIISCQQVRKRIYGNNTLLKSADHYDFLQVIPPDKEFEYFKDAKNHPFKYLAEKFDGRTYFVCA